MEDREQSLVRDSLAAERKRSVRLWCGLAAAVGILLASIPIGSHLQARQRVNALVGQLLVAETDDVPDIVNQLEPYGRSANKPLRERLAGAEPGSKEHLHLALALMPEDPSVAAEVRAGLPDAEPEQLAVICERLDRVDAVAEDNFWQILEDDGESSGRRLNSACALAKFAPQQTQRWERAAPSIARHLLASVKRSPSDYGPYSAALRPVGQRLCPHLADTATDPNASETERIFALDLLFDYAGDQPQTLAEVLFQGDAAQFQQVLAKLAVYRNRTVGLCRAEVERTARAIATDVSLPEADKERLAIRQANAAAALLRLQAADQAWAVFEHSPDPRARTYLIHHVARLRVDPELLLAKLADARGDVSVRRALLLSLGEYDKEQFPEARRQELVSTLLDLYRTHTDPGLHAAAGWLLARWDRKESVQTADDEMRETCQQFQNRPDSDRRQWYVTGEGHTMVMIEGDTFLMGWPESDPERPVGESQYPKRITRQFALSACAVTRKQYERFQASSPHDQTDLVYDPGLRTLVQTEDSPVVAATWYEAAAYCNWLSQREGIPEEQWCYQPTEDGRFAAGMKPKPKYLGLIGYRLPSEGEWEFACRAGSVTRRYYGHGDDMLAHYAWYRDYRQYQHTEQRTWPVASKKPNDFGLFDMHGNVWTWCHDSLGHATASEDDVEDISVLQDHVIRALRGGSVRTFAFSVQSAHRNAAPPVARMVDIGFRVARTCR
jgi:formylglycine-generating enzyme required for sulfatase activity